MSNQQGFRSLSTFKKELHRLKSLFATVPKIPSAISVLRVLLTIRRIVQLINALTDRCYPDWEALQNSSFLSYACAFLGKEKCSKA